MLPIERFCTRGIHGLTNLLRRKERCFAMVFLHFDVVREMRKIASLGIFLSGCLIRLSAPDSRQVINLLYPF